MKKQVLFIFQAIINKTFLKSSGLPITNILKSIQKYSESDFF